jgi:hypothetical protein
MPTVRAHFRKLIANRFHDAWPIEFINSSMGPKEDDSAQGSCDALQLSWGNGPRRYASIPQARILEIPWKQHRLFIVCGAPGTFWKIRKLFEKVTLRPTSDFTTA